MKITPVTLIMLAFFIAFGDFRRPVEYEPYYKELRNPGIVIYKDPFIPSRVVVPYMATTRPDPKFNAARKLIQKASPHINFNLFCSKTAKGEDKLGCRIKKEPTVGFLVCLKPEYEEKSCADTINLELKNLKTVGKSNVRTVKFDNRPLPPKSVDCPTKSGLCSGFLEEWIDNKDGFFGHIRDSIVDGKVKNLTDKVLRNTVKTGLKSTADDLKNIMEFMEQKGKPYQQICDLQGFFLKNGGFLVNDVPEIGQDMTLDEKCWNGEPTTRQVFDALTYMIKEFEKQSSTNLFKYRLAAPFHK